MKEDQQYSAGEGDEYSSQAETDFHWWRSGATAEEMSTLKINSVADMAVWTPRLKVMRELERLAIVAPDGLDDLRHRLVAYRAGDLWVPVGGVVKEGMNIPAQVTILLVGFSGGGKSSLVNLMYSVLGRAGIIPFAQTSGSSSLTSGSTTILLEEHNVTRSMRAGFCVYDSRGFDYDDRQCESLADLSEWTVKGVKHNQVCRRTRDTTDPVSAGTSSKFTKRQVNCAIVVANMAEIYEEINKTGGFKHLEATKQVFSYSGLKRGNQNPILILTHGDKLPVSERINTRVKICEYLGISETSGVYDVVCMTEYGVAPEECDPVTSYAVTEAVYRALLISDMTHSPKLNRTDKALYYLLCTLQLIGLFFAFLARIFSSPSQKYNKMA